MTFTEAQLMAWLSPVFWPFIRILAVFTSAPIFSSRGFPVRARILLALWIAIAAQASLPEMPPVLLNSELALGALIQQIAVGLTLGFIVRLIFACLEFAGELVGAQMGLNYAAFFDPSLGGSASTSARFFAYIGSLVFVVSNGHMVVLLAVVRSFEVFPVGQGWWESLSHLEIQRLGSELFATALWMALPMMGMLMFANMVLGIISRIAPQMNVFAIGFPVTLTVGLIGMLATLPMLELPMLALLERSIALFLQR
jgi:flagellar biosynthetic protein FliR